MTPKEYFEKNQEQLLADPANVEKAKSEVGAIYKFVVTGDNGGTWVLNFKDDVGLTEGDGDAGCTVTVTDSDFMDIVEGRIDGQMAFMQGKLRIDGDMALAMKLQLVLSEIK